MSFKNQITCQLTLEPSEPSLLALPHCIKQFFEPTKLPEGLAKQWETVSALRNLCSDQEVNVLQ